SVRAPLARVRALDEAMTAAAESLSASVDCLVAAAASARAFFALASASSASLPSPPMTLPDNSLVFMSAKSPRERPTTSTIVEILSSFFLPRSGNGAKSAITSPAQPRMTNASNTYSAVSQCPRDCERDDTSEGTRIILAHKDEQNGSF